MKIRAKKPYIIALAVILAIAGFFGMAHIGYAATGSISANPSFFDGSSNLGPFTSSITWDASGFDEVSGAVVYVAVDGGEENLFSYQNSCSGQDCPANWITPDTAQKTYEFRLYEYNSFTGWVGQRLGTATITVSPSVTTGGGGGCTVNCGGGAPAPSGSISANPTICTIPSGGTACSSYIAWTTLNVSDARVYLTTTDDSSETLFAQQTSCSGVNCPAAWIQANITYYFSLYDYSSGFRGQLLWQATVIAIGGGGGCTNCAPTLTITPSSASIAVNSTANFIALYDQDGPGGSQFGNQDVASVATWSSHNPSVAASFGNGQFLGQGNGATTVAASYAGLTATATLTVAAATTGGGGICNGNPTLVITPPQTTVAIGQTAAFTALYDPDGPSCPQGNQNINSLASWNSNNLTAAISLGGGQFLAQANGAASITAFYNGITATAALSVAGGGGVCAGVAPTLIITPSVTSISVGQTAAFTAFYDPDGPGCPQSNQSVTGSAVWNSNNSSIASSLGGGSFQGQGNGTAGITASYAGLTATATLTVSGAGGGVCTGTSLPTLVINPSGASVTVGQTMTFAALYDSDGSGCPNGTQDVAGSATWNSNNSSIATSVGNGSFRGQGNGTAGITVFYSGLSAAATLTVSGAGGFINTFTNYFYPTGGAPTVATNPATNVIGNAVALNGQVVPNNSETQAWFEYGITPGTLTFATNFVVVGNGQYSVPFSQLVNVNPGTIYYFRAVARNTYGFAYGQVLSFVAGGGLLPVFAGSRPVVVTRPATLISQNSALANANVNPAGGITSAWFEYGPSSALGIRTNPQPAGSGLAPISYAFALSGLLPNTTYYVKAVAQNQFGISAGALLSFKTLPVVAVQTAPTVTATGITASSASLKAISCVTLVPTLSARELPAGEEYTYTITYRNGCSFNLTNATMNVTLPVEVNFLSTSYPVFTQNGNTVYYNLGTILPGVELAINIRGTVNDNVKIGDHLIFTALMGFFGAKNNYESLSAYLTAVVTQGPNGRPILSATLLATIKDFLGNWLFWILLILIIFVLLYLIFRGRRVSDGEKQIDLSAFRAQ